MTQSTQRMSQVPDAQGRFGEGRYGGRYVPETLMAALELLGASYEAARADDRFQAELASMLRHYAGRPTPLYFARRLTEHYNGGRIYLKREDLAHTGSHKINNTLGQCLLAVRMGKKRVIAETGAGQHGVATATAAAVLGLSCRVYMGTEDVRRQQLNVFRMKMLGAEVVEVSAGSATLKDATNEAMRDWMASSADTHYVIGSVVGPDPFPRMVRDFQAIIGREAREQMIEQAGRRPDVVIACVGGGSNAAGIFYTFVDEPSVRLIGVEAGGRGMALGDNSASLTAGHPGVLHGALTYVLSTDDGQTAPAHSIAAGLDYPGTGPEHSYWKDAGRVEYVTRNDNHALTAFSRLCRMEGLIPALESAHAIACLDLVAPQTSKDQLIVVNLSGRGDKDCAEVMRLTK
ncbi:MAG: tryptophan synthase subunit beta [Phycisphaerae bacterium]|nr:tryptophan synthase subunit beta [Phycisphaerae bacterium]